MCFVLRPASAVVMTNYLSLRVTEGDEAIQEVDNTLIPNLMIDSL